MIQKYVTARVHHARREVLTACGARRNAPGVLAAPHPDTVGRVFRELGAQALAHHAGAYLAMRELRGPVTFPVTAADASNAFVHPFIYAGRAVCEAA